LRPVPYLDLSVLQLADVLVHREMEFRAWFKCGVFRVTARTMSAP
jgi:hypothetical protein